ncbi:MAG: hypothetical protein V7K68_31590 [Nostoc sp.]|uniref:hypothetical protein n=1 Tax=Nostoc sp. TaxID=1180 RepID=UPI002FFA6831
MSTLFYSSSPDHSDESDRTSKGDKGEITNAPCPTYLVRNNCTKVYMSIKDSSTKL